MGTVFGAERKATVCRELTKKFEETQPGTLCELTEHYTNVATPKGEIVIVLGPPVEKKATQDEIDQALLTVLKDFKVKDAAKQVSQSFGISRNRAYMRALELKNDS
jgi:16S rRNA (cytidine1402-2'-O)-methyltransferase